MFTTGIQIFWDSQDFDDISMVLKMSHFRKSTGPRWVNTGVGNTTSTAFAAIFYSKYT